MASNTDDETPDLWLSAVRVLSHGLSNGAYRKGANSLCVVNVQAHNPIPDDAWEYQIRKSLNDAAYNGLQYVPYCSTMPVQEKCDDAKFMWVRSVRTCRFCIV